MKTKFFSFFAASAMMLLAASCSSTDVEESLLPEESVNGECVTVSLDIPANDMPMSRAVPAGWELRYVVWLVTLGEDGSPVAGSDGKAIMQVGSSQYAAGNSLKFTGVAPGKYSICAFCGYFKEDCETFESKAPYTYFKSVGSKNGSSFDFFVEMNSQYKDAANSDNDVINFYNDLYDCWKVKIDFTKEEANAKVSLALKRAVSKVYFNNNVSSATFTNEDLASLRFRMAHYIGINLWGDDACTTSNGSVDYEITDWSEAIDNTILVMLYLPKQSRACSAELVPVAKPDMDDADFDYFKEATVKNLLFDKVNVIYNVRGNFLVDCGTKVTVDATTDTNWENGGYNMMPSIEYSNPQLN